jgi:hypothetical protein
MGKVVLAIILLALGLFLWRFYRNEKEYLGDLYGPKDLALTVTLVPAGYIISLVGAAVFLGPSIWGLVLLWPYLGPLLGDSIIWYVILFELAIPLGPIYALLGFGEWMPAVVNWLLVPIGVVVGVLLFGLGRDLVDEYR